MLVTAVFLPTWSIERLRSGRGEVLVSGGAAAGSVEVSRQRAAAKLFAGLSAGVEQPSDDRMGNRA